MKIKSIKISGFRGIPPVDPPNVEIDLTSLNGGVKNLLLFGPNAYGKSSIADALEWFFKENVRSNSYFEEYRDSDNVHVKLGQTGFTQEAYIEIIVDHNGTDYTLRKEIDQSGKKIRENLSGLQSVIQQLENEIIVLDHDQFRKFVSAANAEKWTTFSSLIGYEELDYFRSGIDSLSSRSLTDYLHRTQLEREEQQLEIDINRKLEQSFQTFRVEGSSLKDLIGQFRTLLEITLTSLEYPTPTMDDDLSDDFWEVLRTQVKSPEANSRASARLGELTLLLEKLTPFTEEFKTNLEAFQELSRDLDQQKNKFDKKVLSEFYQKGLQVLSENKSTPDLCPFCGTSFPWKNLILHVESQHRTLDFSDIEKQHSALVRIWETIKQSINDRRMILSNIDLSEIKEAYNRIGNTSRIYDAIFLHTFNTEIVNLWILNVNSLSELILTTRKTVEKERSSVQDSLDSSLIAEMQSKIEELYQFWTQIQSLTKDFKELNKKKRNLVVVDGVIECLRNTTSRFRNELSDFSGRVVQIINHDVEVYYDELHPNDKIKPYLDVSVRGSQRTVNLLCDFRGVPDKAAVTLLSESHRNSLGMAILLAFIKYKHQTGSPVGFLIFDDVTQSFDSEHRTNLLTLLENPKFPEISQQQILFLTHDRTLADFIKRSRETNTRKDWLRVDIRNWWLERMVIESETESDPLNRAQYYININDEIAAGIYVRRSLEQIYKLIIQKANIKIPFSEKPWKIGMENYRDYILNEVTELWNDNKGFIDPNDPMFHQLFKSQRILNMTVHDSQFLENPMTLGDVQNALSLVQQLQSRFTCTCGEPYHTIRKNGTSNPKCKKQNCTNLLS